MASMLGNAWGVAFGRWPEGGTAKPHIGKAKSLLNKSTNVSTVPAICSPVCVFCDSLAARADALLAAQFGAASSLALLQSSGLLFVVLSTESSGLSVHKRLKSWAPRSGKLSVLDASSAGISSLAEEVGESCTCEPSRGVEARAVCCAWCLANASRLSKRLLDLAADDRNASGTTVFFVESLTPLLDVWGASQVRIFLDLLASGLPLADGAERGVTRNVAAVVATVHTDCHSNAEVGIILRAADAVCTVSSAVPPEGCDIQCSWERRATTSGRVTRFPKSYKFGAVSAGSGVPYALEELAPSDMSLTEPAAGDSGASDEVKFAGSTMNLGLSEAEKAQRAAVILPHMDARVSMGGRLPASAQAASSGVAGSESDGDSADGEGPVIYIDDADDFFEEEDAEFDFD